MYHRLLQEREEDYLDVAKILVLNGSPHKSASTTMAVTNAFVKGMCEGCEYESEIINISDLNVTPCMGCLSCWARTEGECVIKNDDMPAVKKRIEEADIIIESYPLYFFGMPGQMKLFTDRLLSMMCTYRGQKPTENGESFHGKEIQRRDRNWFLYRDVLIRSQSQSMIRFLRNMSAYVVKMDLQQFYVHS